MSKLIRIFSRKNKKRLNKISIKGGAYQGGYKKNKSTSKDEVIVIGGRSRSGSGSRGRSGSGSGSGRRGRSRSGSISRSRSKPRITGESVLREYNINTNNRPNNNNPNNTITSGGEEMYIHDAMRNEGLEFYNEFFDEINTKPPDEGYWVRLINYVDKSAFYVNPAELLALIYYTVGKHKSINYYQTTYKHPLVQLVHSTHNNSINKLTDPKEGKKSNIFMKEIKSSWIEKFNKNNILFNYYNQNPNVAKRLISNIFEKRCTSKHPNEEIILYKGYNGPTARLKIDSTEETSLNFLHFPTNTHINCNNLNIGFISTSTNIGSAEEFSNGGILIKFILDTNVPVKAIHILCSGHGTYENEVLLCSKTKFKFMRTEQYVNYYNEQKKRYIYRTCDGDVSAASADGGGASADGVAASASADGGAGGNVKSLNFLNELEALAAAEFQPPPPPPLLQQQSHGFGLQTTQFQPTQGFGLQPTQFQPPQVYTQPQSHGFGLQTTQFQPTQGFGLQTTQFQPPPTQGFGLQTTQFQPPPTQGFGLPQFQPPQELTLNEILYKNPMNEFDLW